MMEIARKGSDAKANAMGRSAAIHVALFYESSTSLNQWFSRLVEEFRRSGKSVAGLVQQDVPHAGRSRCDMVLHELATGRSIVISEDLGEGAISCRLSYARLLDAAQLVENQLADAEIIFLNKFGKAEAEGGGFRDLIARCIEGDKSILVGVPLRNEREWTEFCGEFFTSVVATPAPQPRAVAELAKLFNPAAVENRLAQVT